jgi:hypothetical protein
MFTFDETNLMCIYNTGSRLGLIAELTSMQKHLEADETELIELTRSTLEKLNAMSDMEFEAIDLTPDYGEDEQEG